MLKAKAQREFDISQRQLRFPKLKQPKIDNQLFAAPQTGLQ
jgi:hypothetical protein